MLDPTDPQSQSKHTTEAWYQRQGGFRSVLRVARRRASAQGAAEESRQAGMGGSRGGTVLNGRGCRAEH